MSLISFSPLQDGVTGVNAAATNTPLSTIYNDYNGNVTDANISSSAAIAFSKIAGGSATGLVAWTSWVPSLTNMTGGTVTYAKYVQIGKTVFYRFKYTLGGTGISGSVSFSLPVTANADYTVDNDIGAAHFIDNGTQLYTGYVGAGSSTTGTFKLFGVSGSNIIGTTNLSSTAPFTWNTADYLIANGSYEAA